MSVRKLLVSSLVIFSMLGIAACGSKQETSTGSTSTPEKEQQAQTEQKKGNSYVIASGSEKGVYFPVGNGIAETCTKNSVTMTNLKSAGSRQNIDFLTKNDAQFGIAQNIDAYDAVKGAGDFQGDERKSIRGVIAIFPSIAHFVVKSDAKASSISDLKGKDFAVGPSGSGTERNSRDILKAYGLDYVTKTDLKAKMLSFDDAVTAMGQGKAIGGMFSSGIPFKAVQDCFQKYDVKMLNVDDAKAGEIIKANPSYFKYTIKAGTYGEKQSKDVKTLGAENLLICNKDVPEDVVYNVIKALYDNNEALVKYHDSLKDATIQNALQGMSIPLHKGAIKFLTEKGIEIPANLKPAND